MTDDELTAAGDDLVAHLCQLGDGVTATTRLLTLDRTTSTPAKEHP